MILRALDWIADRIALAVARPMLPALFLLTRRMRRTDRRANARLASELAVIRRRAIGGSL